MASLAQSASPTKCLIDENRYFGSLHKQGLPITKDKLRFLFGIPHICLALCQKNDQTVSAFDIRYRSLPSYFDLYGTTTQRREDAKCRFQLVALHSGSKSITLQRNSRLFLSVHC